MTDKKILVCFKCQKELIPEKTNFTYLGHSFYTDVLKCPQCREVFIPEDMAKGRIADVEMQLEDK